MRMHWHAPRRLRSGVLLLVLGAVVLAVAIAMAAEKPRLESAWTAEAPEIDGKLTDWPSPLVTLGSVPLSMGMRNDGQFVYVALAASDQPTRMMLAAAGFTVWCDPAGKEKKSFGIMVPAVMAGGPGMRGRGPSGGPPGQGGQPPDWQGMPPQGRGDPPDQAGPPAQGQEGQDPKPKGGPAGAAVQPIRHIEVAGAKKDDRRRLELEYARTIGLDAVARMAEGVLVYEIRIPLSASEAQPYAVRSTPGVTIGVGVESAELQDPGGRGEEGGPGRGGMGGGAPGGGGGRGGGIGGMGGGSRGGMGGSPTGGGREGTRGMKPIKVWTTVHLAKAPA